MDKIYYVKTGGLCGVEGKKLAEHIKQKIIKDYGIHVEIELDEV